MERKGSKFQREEMRHKSTNWAKIQRYNDDSSQGRFCCENKTPSLWGVKEEEEVRLVGGERMRNCLMTSDYTQECIWVKLSRDHPLLRALKRIIIKCGNIRYCIQRFGGFPVNSVGRLILNPNISSWNRKKIGTIHTNKAMFLVIWK